ncbi:MAG: hypothetical protein KTR24_07080 [Saprospiraceae bacterium]|nr:hypothetical protein [Saprospiraceae bacterium]
MKITAEISLYPLHAAYGTLVLDFIKAMQDVPDITLRTNSMSTQVSGTWVNVMDAIGGAYATTFSEDIGAALIMKVFNQELEMEWISL